MPRPKKCRRICAMPAVSGFIPSGSSEQKSSPVEMTVDEYETIRLIDLLACTQDDCARQMGVARTTVQAIYESARYKLALALTGGRPLVIRGGDYVLCDRSENCCGKSCRGGSCDGRRCGNGAGCCSCSEKGGSQ
ncbi:MAG: DUF134 domain-containing protein [Oscillospiraceae bacterium]|nr:DUF134 domain-containing protein [Oscillospiraceae bacterium]